MTRGRRRICFVTGTRAEFGLMRSTLKAIKSHPKLRLQLVVTGMHLDAAHGRSIDTIRKEGWKIDATVSWPRAANPSQTARRMGRATAELAGVFDELGSEVVLVVGDRVEAFAAASAAHVSGRVIAHVHGGDRALGLVDDSLRHAITKLAHVHFPATEESARRIFRLGEDTWRIHRVGSPGIDGILSAAGRSVQVKREFRREFGYGFDRRSYALLVLHPTSADEDVEHNNAREVLRATLDAGVRRVVIVYPNNDPGGRGIARCWDRLDPDKRVAKRRDVPRALFLALLRDAAMLVGNSSSGIIEAASFGTPVVDVGDRQAGRERGENVVNVPVDERLIRDAVAEIWRDGKPRRFPLRNIYGGACTAKRVANTLARLSVDDRLLRKLIAY